MKEQWKPVSGYPNYEVSSFGRVRSLARIDGYGRRRTTKLLKLRPQKSGHLTVALYADGARHDASVHVLVAEAFIGPRPPGMEVCHWNDVPSDNRVINLRWDTRSANVLDSVRNGGHPMANKTHCPKGHAYTQENTYIYPQGRRACNLCRQAYRERNAEVRRVKGREYMRARREKLKQESGVS